MLYDRGVRLALALACMAACGRLGFDASRDGAPGGGGDGPHDASRDGSPSGIALRQGSGSVMGSVHDMSITLPGEVTAGDLLILGVSADTPPEAVSLSDTLGTSYTLVSNATAIPLPVYLAMAFAPATGADTIALHVNTAPNSYLELQAWEYAGIAPGPPEDVAQMNGTTTATDGAATRPLVASTNNELLFGWGVFFVDGAVGTGFTEVSNIGSDPAEQRILDTPGAYLATMTLLTSSGLWTVVGATFRGQ